MVSVGMELAGVLERATVLGVAGLEREYEDLLKGVPGEERLSCIKCNEFPDKNRYRDVGCWDQSRVELMQPTTSEDGVESDYIHANWVDGGRRPKEFICAQGPTDDTRDDFWQMVWEQRVPTIIMLCLCREDGRPKCAQYWPLRDSLRLESGYQIKFLHRETIQLADQVLVDTLLELKKGDSDETRTIRHTIHTNWPDRSVPSSAAPLLGFISRVNQLHGEMAMVNGWRGDECPKLVHCSAGIGRTGTLVALDIATSTQPSTLSVSRLVARLRLQRKGAVQNSHQYLFIYIVLLHSLLSRHPHLPVPPILNALNQAVRRPIPTIQQAFIPSN